MFVLSPLSFVFCLCLSFALSFLVLLFSFFLFLCFVWLISPSDYLVEAMHTQSELLMKSLYICMSIGCTMPVFYERISAGMWNASRFCSSLIIFTSPGALGRFSFITLDAPVLRNQEGGGSLHPQPRGTFGH